MRCVLCRESVSTKESFDKYREVPRGSWHRSFPTIRESALQEEVAQPTSRIQPTYEQRALAASMPMTVSLPVEVHPIVRA